MTMVMYMVMAKVIAEIKLQRCYNIAISVVMIMIITRDHGDVIIVL